MNLSKGTYNVLRSVVVTVLVAVVALFALLYLLYCWYMARRNMDNIGHTAHFWGAVYGLAFPLLFRPDIFLHFLSQLGL